MFQWQGLRKPKPSEEIWQHCTSFPLLNFPQKIRQERVGTRCLIKAFLICFSPRAPFSPNTYCCWYTRWCLNCSVEATCDLYLDLKPEERESGENRWTAKVTKVLSARQLCDLDLTGSESAECNPSLCNEFRQLDFSQVLCKRLSKLILISPRTLLLSSNIILKLSFVQLKQTEERDRHRSPFSWC